MIGAIRQTDPTEPQDAGTFGGIASTAEYRYMYEHRKDLAGHVWAVAAHHPDLPITVDEDGRPTSLPWVLDSLHEASGNSMARGKRLWTEELKPKVGGFEKFDLHYGLARYLLVPLSAGLTLADNRPDLDAANLLQQRNVNDVAQVRVERVKVETRDSMLAQFAPMAAITFDKPFRPLCPGREKTPRLPRIESELQALFNDAGELKDVVEEEQEQEQRSGTNVRSLGRTNEALHSNPPQVYEQWAAGPHTPALVPYWASLVPSPPPAPRKRFSGSLGAGIANIGKQIHRNTVAMHTKKRLAVPTVDARGSPIERTDRRIYTSSPSVPVLRLDTPGRVRAFAYSDPSVGSFFADVSLLFFRLIGRPGYPPLNFHGQQGNEDVRILLLQW
jgi:hypothetical protein